MVITKKRINRSKSMRKRKNGEERVYMKKIGES
jgi:hypothetical protein